MSEDLLILAMKKAVESDKRTIQYIKGILNNWNKKGIKTALEVEKEDTQFKQNKNRKETEEEEFARRLKELEEATKNDVE